MIDEIAGIENMSDETVEELEEEIEQLKQEIQELEKDKAKLEKSYEKFASVLQEISGRECVTKALLGNSSRCNNSWEQCSRCLAFDVLRSERMS